MGQESTFFMLFIGKKQTNMAVAWAAQTESKIEFVSFLIYF